MVQVIRKPVSATPGSQDRLDRSLQDALADSRRRYKDLVEISSDFAWETDGRVFVFVSPRGALGYESKDLVGREIAALMGDAAAAAEAPFAINRPVNGVEFWCSDAAGAARRLRCSAVPIHDEQGRWIGARGVAQDITEQGALEEALARAHTAERLRNHVLTAIWDNAEPDQMLAAGAKAARRALSADLCAIWRLGDDGSADLVACSGPPDGVVPPLEPPAALLADDGAPVGPVPHVLGGAYAEGIGLLARTADRDGGGGFVAIAREPGRPTFQEDEFHLLSEVAFQLGIAIAHVEHHARLDRLARIDGLTGLLVRRAFIDAVEARLMRPGALLYIDLDNFKPVNDTHGHEAGDRVLCQVAGQLADAAGETGLAARLGGDEFAIWLDDAALTTAKKVARALQGNAGLDEFSADATRPLGYSIGIAGHDLKQPESLDELIARADAAMYAVKRAGKGGLQIAAPPGASPDGDASSKAAPNGDTSK